MWAAVREVELKKMQSEQRSWGLAELRAEEQNAKKKPPDERLWGVGMSPAQLRTDSREAVVLGIQNYNKSKEKREEGEEYRRKDKYDIGGACL